MWDELRIERTNDVRAIKRAYATRLKTERPDKDPLRFSVLREAYEAALAHAAGLVDEEAPKAAVALQQVVVSSSPVLPPVVRPKFDMESWQVQSEPISLSPRIDEAREMDAKREAKFAPTSQTSIRSLLDELHRALQNPWGETYLSSLVRKIVAHPDLQRFSSRDPLEIEIVRLLVNAQLDMPEVLGLCDQEFGWSRDHVDLMRRCPDEADALLKLLAKWGVSSGVGKDSLARRPRDLEVEAKALKRRERSIQFLNAHWFQRCLVLLFLPSLRDAIADLLIRDEVSAIVSQERRQWWLNAIRIFPPLGVVLTSFTECVALIYVFSGGRTGEFGNPLPWLERIGLPILAPLIAWLVLSVPWHYARRNPVAFGSIWVYAAIAAFLVPWGAEVIPLWAFFFLPLGWFFYALWRMSGPRVLRVSLAFCASGAIFAIPRAIEPSSWSTLFVILCLGFVAVLSTVRHFKQGETSFGLWVIIVFIATTIFGVERSPATTVYGIAALLLAAIWVSEEAIYRDRGAPRPAPALQGGLILLAIAALILASTSLPVELRYLILVGALLAGERLEPLRPFTWMLESDGTNRISRIITLIVLGFLLSLAFAAIPLPNRVDDIAYAVLNGMVAARVVWTLYRYLD
jgi:hypothetical protein